ncbi:hypothetical protein A2U01_0108445, partial [Trifolium medium]|nr:hypothetical protein [Trifolium medium]
MTGKGKAKSAVNPMITVEGVMLVVEGSRVTELAIGAVEGVICHMIAQG